MIKRPCLRAGALCALSTAVLLTSAPQVYAQNGLMLEEVLVTARKRAESLQDAPLAVSAFNGDALADAGISNLADVTELVPNLQISRPSRDSSIYIRGVGPARGATNVTELSVGVYIDDVYLLKPQGQMMDLAEIEQVQVLRGPQGTLFGKNTTGGAMLVTTVKPTDEFGGYVQVTAGNQGRLNAQGSIDVPLGENFLSKLTVTSVKSDGFFKDPVHGTELSDDDRLGALLQLRWQPSDELTADFSLAHNKIRENVLAMGNCQVVNPNSIIAGNQLITPATGNRQLADFCREVNDIHGGRAPYWTPNRFYDLDASQASMQVSWDVTENMTLKSTTSWRNQETPNMEYTNTYVGFPNDQVVLENGDQTQISQELQLTGEIMDGRVRFASGIYYLEDDSETGTRDSTIGLGGIWASVRPEVPAGLAAALTQGTRTGQHDKNDTFAAFTQWSWDLTDKIELTAGIRYSEENRSLTTRRANMLLPGQAYANVPGAIVIDDSVVLFFLDDYFGSTPSALPIGYGPTQVLRGEQSFSSVTPMFSASYKFENSLLYMSYTQGFKAGGLSDFGTGELSPFDEENIDNLEFGIKMDAWDNRLRLNFAYFMMDYEDMQLFVARPDPTPNAIGTLQGVTNAGQSSIDGAELELTLLPAEGWLVNMSASYADGEFKEFFDFSNDLVTGEALLVNRTDEDLPSLPEFTFGIGAQYEWQNDSGTWLARVDAYYRDDLYWGFDSAAWDIPAAREASTADSYVLFNARMHWQLNDSMSVAIWGKNLTDEEYSDGGVGEATNLGIASAAFSPPRRYGIDVRYDF